MLFLFLFLLRKLLRRLACKSLTTLRSLVYGFALQRLRLLAQLVHFALMPINNILRLFIGIKPPPLSCRGFEPSLTPTLKQKSGVHPRFFVLMVVREGIVLRRCACFGHSVAFCSPRFAFACLLTSNLRPSLKISPPEIFFFSGLRRSPVRALRRRHIK